MKKYFKKNKLSRAKSYMNKDKLVDFKISNELIENIGLALNVQDAGYYKYKAEKYKLKYMSLIN